MHQNIAFVSFICLTLVSYVSAAVINPAPEPGSSYFKGVVILLALSLALLFIAKWVYQSRRYRHTSFSSADSWRARSLRSQLDDNLFQSVYIFSKTPNEKGKSGFLVGLFGSPSWETRYSNIFQMASEQISLNRALHLTATPRHHGSQSRFTVTEIQNKQAEDLSEAELGLRTFCEPLLLEPPPVMTSNTYPPWNLTRPVSSKDLCPDQSSKIELLSDSIVRLIPDRSAHCILDFPEPTHSSTPCSHDSHLPCLSNCKSMHTYTWDSVTRVQPTSRSALESKSHFCHISNRNSQPKAFQTILHEDEASVKQAKKIYLISPSTSISLYKQLMNSNSAQGCNQSRSMPISAYTFDALGPFVEQENATVLSPAYVSVIEVDAVEDIIPNLRTSSSLLQQKLDPKIGPSPLRTMFLHDSGDTDNKIRRNDYSQSHDISEENLVSIEESLSRSNPSMIDDVKYSCGHQRKSNRYQTKLRAKSQDSESLFDLIQELVRETSAWDDSLFVDHKFKAMIDGSKPVTTVSLPNKHKGWRRSHKSRRPSTQVLEGIPEMEAEIALGED